jgi:hypothetical protein
MRGGFCMNYADKTALVFIILIIFFNVSYLIGAEPNQNAVAVNPQISITLPKAFSDVGTSIEQLVQQNKTTAFVVGAFMLAPLIYTTYRVNRRISSWILSATNWLAGTQHDAKKWSCGKIAGYLAGLSTFVGLSLIEGYMLITCCKKLAIDAGHVLGTLKKLQKTRLSISIN